MASLDIVTAREIYRSIRASREIDILEQEYVRRGEAFFHVSGAGHENIAFLHPHLIAEDFLHCHYRDKSLMLARGVDVEQFFLSLFCKDQSHSRGRQMSAHISDPACNIMSTVGPVGNNALQAVGAASLLKGTQNSPIVYCGMGDGTSQQGEVFEAIAHAVRESLPILFVVQDNSYAISTRTKGHTFFSRPDGNATDFYGIPLEWIDGRDPIASYRELGRIVLSIRQTSKPAIAIFQVARLNSHTNADDQTVYRTASEIEADRLNSDPLIILERWLLQNGVAGDELESIGTEVGRQVREAAEAAQRSPEPVSCMTAKAELPKVLTDAVVESCDSLGWVDGTEDGLTMLEAIREVLKCRMKNDDRITLFGEDLEDPKGDVFGLTRGLSSIYPGRVMNSPLAEASIVGLSIGRALVGGRPVCFLQFADFLPIAFNQIWAELGSMFWRTAGGWKVPVIVMATCGGFKPGLGPFHASSMESFAAHIPGVDVFLPSTASDAAGLLNASFESERPTIFFYPKSILNDRTRATSCKVVDQLIPIGKARFCRRGDDITLVGWGNLVAMLEKASAVLEQKGVSCDLIDLRSISPWDCEAIIESVARTGRLLIAQEDNISVSVASEIAVVVAERLDNRVMVRRVARPDTFVPCNFSNQLQVLPSYQRILETAVAMLGGKIVWGREHNDTGSFIVEAIGSSPADQTLTVIEWKVQLGEAVRKGQILADVEADKAIFEIASPVEGVLEELIVPAGQMVEIGAAIAKIGTSFDQNISKVVSREDPGIPEITIPKHRDIVASVLASRSESEGVRMDAGGRPGIVAIASQVGGRLITNDDIAQGCSKWEANQIFESFGIRNRYWVDVGENVLTLAVTVARKLLESQKLCIGDIDMLLVATGSPLEITPSLACLVLAELAAEGQPTPFIQASDLNAACSGYLYALQSAYDFLSARPDGRVLVVTSEVLSDALDKSDPATVPIFGDAATATLLVGAGRSDQIEIILERPVLGAQGDDGSILRVPRDLGSKIYMDGPKVYHAAVRNMVLFLEHACQQAGVDSSELDLVIAHQANQRILDSVRLKAHLTEQQVYSAIADFGNTSSSSIPLCIDRLWADLPSGKTWGLCAFGGGFTFGGAVLRTLGRRHSKSGKVRDVN